MEKLHSAQDAIKQVYDKEYLPAHFVSSFNYGHESWIDNEGMHFSIQDVEQKGSPVKVNDILLDPLFWQALGRVRGWVAENPILPPEWLHHAEYYFHIRLSGGDETKFWESLP
jgi:hypothetical protein